MMVKPMQHLGKRAAGICLFWLVLALQLAVSGAIAAQLGGPVANQPPLMDPQKEIALALSACPTSVAGKAAVYILQLSGYVKVHAGPERDSRPSSSTCCRQVWNRCA